MGNESPEAKKYADKYIEGAMRNNDQFLAELSEATDLEQLKQIIRDYTFIDGEGEAIVFEIIKQEGEEDDARTFSEDELLKAVELMKGGVPDKHEIESWIPHGPIAKAVLRITGKE